MPKTASTAELRKNIAKYLRYVQGRKKTILVTRYSKIVASLEPR